MWSVELVESAIVKFPALLAGMSYHYGQVRRLFGKVHLIATVQLIKLYSRKNSESNSYLLLNPQVLEVDP